MTPAQEADARIILSRKTIGTYLAMIEHGTVPNTATMLLISEEIALLEGLALAHPGKAIKIARLIDKWRGVVVKLRTSLH